MQERAFTGPACPDDAQKLPSLDVQVQAAENLHRIRATTVAFRQSDCL
jgi:hypothetical protein